ncbi:hypothetical protein BWI93_03150 [Siphonobacter sp. BAB-5385]|uniref:hypothetical protein n=1 Tax=Siphonobacter sp. BAB-5385 TaxID=1864822 RepID=UPI000B9E32F7|nr:hypothetical protein [Siphonobacter sp. BAB-5385]OZI09593.1 hypothetical protein BWI93_03150 [Siphonobacter sp. BAB-5385]
MNKIFKWVSEIWWPWTKGLLKKWGIAIWDWVDDHKGRILFAAIIFAVMTIATYYGIDAKRAYDRRQIEKLKNEKLIEQKKNDSLRVVIADTVKAKNFQLDSVLTTFNEITDSIRRGNDSLARLYLRERIYRSRQAQQSRKTGSR